jgi:integrase
VTGFTDQIIRSAISNQGLYRLPARDRVLSPQLGQLPVKLLSDLVLLFRPRILGAAFKLRHTHASNLLSRGVPLPAVSARLGHADANVTARVYSHALPADDQRSADTWDSIIDGPVQ